MLPCRDNGEEGAIVPIQSQEIADFACLTIQISPASAVGCPLCRNPLVMLGSPHELTGNQQVYPHPACSIGVRAVCPCDWQGATARANPDRSFLTRGGGTIAAREWPPLPCAPTLTGMRSGPATTPPASRGLPPPCGVESAQVENGACPWARRSNLRTFVPSLRGDLLWRAYHMKRQSARNSGFHPASGTMTATMPSNPVAGSTRPGLGALAVAAPHLPSLGL
jgi:hypothetical protein